MFTLNLLTIHQFMRTNQTLVVNVMLKWTLMVTHLACVHVSTESPNGMIRIFVMLAHAKTRLIINQMDHCGTHVIMVALAKPELEKCTVQLHRTSFFIVDQ